MTSPNSKLKKKKKNLNAFKSRQKKFEKSNPPTHRMPAIQSDTRARPWLIFMTQLRVRSYRAAVLWKATAITQSMHFIYARIVHTVSVNERRCGERAVNRTLMEKSILSHEGLSLLMRNSYRTTTVHHWWVRSRTVLTLAAKGNNALGVNYNYAMARRRGRHSVWSCEKSAWSQL